MVGMGLCGRGCDWVGGVSGGRRVCRGLLRRGAEVGPGVGFGGVGGEIGWANFVWGEGGTLERVVEG